MSKSTVNTTAVRPWLYGNYRPFAKRDSISFGPPESSATRQEFADECDINSLMARFEKTGVMSHVNKSAPQYLDVSNVPDLRLSMDILAQAETAFMSLPATVRATFDNDPVKFVEFAQDSSNLPALREMGLAEPLKPEPAPQKVEVVNPAPAAPKAPKEPS